MSDSHIVEADLSYEIVDAFLDSYYRLGYGFLESIYARALEGELSFARKQLLNYLRATGLELGLLLHYGPRPQRFRVLNTESARRPRP